MSHNRILLADDDVELAGLLRDFLAREGFEVMLAHNADDAIAAARAESFDALVLDVMMPGRSGLDALRELRRESALPVLMLTALGEDIDRILGLELGADDYVPKPCSPRELCARLRAILRRTHADAMEEKPASYLAAGELEMWPEQRRAQWAGMPVELTSTEFNLLEVLLRHAGRTVSKNELSEKALGRPLARFDRNVDVHMSSLRHKLGATTDGRSCIQTVHRQGYLLVKE